MGTINVRIQETNEIASIFNTAVEYSSDDLPEWFKPLQYVFEDEGFTNMTIAIKDVHYLIMPAITEVEAPESLDATSATDIDARGLAAVETALQLLAGGITNLRTEMLVVKAHVNRIAENTNTTLDK